MAARAPARSYLLLVGIAAIVVLLDQTSKAIVVRSLRGNAAVQMPGGLFQLNYTQNTGAAFSILQSQGRVFVVVAVAVVVAILVYYWRVRERRLLFGLALGLVLGGAIGNLLDRIRLGYVVDFIDFRWFPVFNLADSSIVCGVGVLILASLLNAGTEA